MLLIKTYRKLLLILVRVNIGIMVTYVAVCAHVRISHGRLVISQPKITFILHDYFLSLFFEYSWVLKAGDPRMMIL